VKPTFIAWDVSPKPFDRTHLLWEYHYLDGGVVDSPAAGQKGARQPHRERPQDPPGIHLRLTGCRVHFPRRDHVVFQATGGPQ
jgi:hypothetical protein